MTDSKTFDARVIGTLTTGTMLGGTMSDVHEAFEHVLGHPVWTHELADKKFWELARADVVAAYPDFPTGKPADWRALADDLVRRYPDGLTLSRGTTDRVKDPLETLQEVMGDKPVIVMGLKP